MYCTYCNFKNESDNKFCESCGKPLQRTDLSSVAPKVVGVKTGKSGFTRKWWLLLVVLLVLVLFYFARSLNLFNFINEEYVAGAKFGQLLAPAADEVGGTNISRLKPPEVQRANCSPPDCSDSEKRSRLNEVDGKRIRWSGAVIGNDSKGVLVFVDDGHQLRLYVVGIPMSERNAFTSNQIIDFEATIVVHHGHYLDGDTFTLEDAKYIAPLAVGDYGVTITDVDYAFNTDTRKYDLTVGLNNSSGTTQRFGIQASLVHLYGSNAGKRLIDFVWFPVAKSDMTEISSGSQVGQISLEGGKLGDYALENRKVVQICVWLRPIHPNNKIDVDSEIDLWELKPRAGCYSTRFKHLLD